MESRSSPPIGKERPRCYNMHSIDLAMRWILSYNGPHISIQNCYDLHDEVHALDNLLFTVDRNWTEGVHAHVRNSSTGRLCENLPVAEAFWLGVFRNPWDVVRAFCAAMVSQTSTTCTGICSSTVPSEFHVPSLSSTFSHHAFVFCGHPLWEAPSLHCRVPFCGRPWPLPANFTMTDT